MTALPLTTPLRDLITIPERIDSADFVLKLHDGVEAADRTLRDYVVTGSIAESMGEALDLVRHAVTNRTSRGAYIHGSFGSGKSHFMAVLHLLLTKHLPARSIDGIAPVVSGHLDVLERNFLAVDYHLIGAKSLESALFTGYLETVASKHPDSAAPVLHVSDGLLADAQRHRSLMGDEAFFGAISPASSRGSGWGALAAGWDAASFDAAVAQQPGDTDRDRLVRDLTRTLFQGYGLAGDWVDITTGLRAMSTHAHGLGYDGIILFLDELVLWLGQHLADHAFISTETSKVAKLVETGSGALPIPFVSFVARQRDLAQFLGGSSLGVEREAQSQSFQWWDDRFEKIQLRAADLPKIVKQRLLQPVDADAADTLAAALNRVRADNAAWNVLLSDEASSGEQEFGSVYPFSPALVDAMVALSNLMQRERTALKLMGELLVEGRDELTASDVIPVGDLYEPVVLGTLKPLDDDMQRLFEVSARFYTEKMRPFVLNKHGLTEGTVNGLARNHPFRTEDRLAKTLLIAALAPGAASLKDLTASKLHALNFGAITAFVPGMETTQALALVRKWAEEFGEIHVGEGSVDPLVSVQLSGVDYDSILSRVRSEDTLPARRGLVRQLVLDELGLRGQSGFAGAGIPFTHVWRGEKKTASVFFGNVHGTADFKDYDFETSPGEWKVFIDFPYAADGQIGPRDDLARINGLRGRGVEGDTIVWLPNFLTTARQNDLGRLVVLEYLLTENRFDQYADHLPPTDRPAARQALENNRANLRESFARALHRAYGVASPDAVDIDALLTPTEIFTNLVSGLTIQPPVTGTLLGGLQGALDQAWKHAYPQHPDLGHAEVRRRDLDDVLTMLTQAVESNGRIENLSTAQKKLSRDIAVPLRLAHQNENKLTAMLAQFGWRDDFTRWEAELGNAVTAGALRARLEPIGMSRDLEDTVILAWSIVADREWVRGSAVTARPGVGYVTDELVLRKANLPSEEAWAAANARVQPVLGLKPEAHLSSGSVNRLGKQIIDLARGRVAGGRALVEQLERHAGPLGIELDAPAGRLRTAREAADLVDSLGRESEPRLAIIALGETTLAADAAALGTSIATADEVSRALSGGAWDMIAKAEELQLAAAADAIATMRKAAAVDESQVPFVDRLMTAGQVARQAVLDATVVVTPPTIEPTDHEKKIVAEMIDARPGASGSVDVSLGDLDGSFNQLRAQIDRAARDSDASTVHITWRLE